MKKKRNHKNNSWIWHCVYHNTRKATLAEHEIQTGDAAPIRAPTYHIPIAYTDNVLENIARIGNYSTFKEPLGFITSSNSQKEWENSDMWWLSMPQCSHRMWPHM